MTLKEISKLVESNTDSIEASQALHKKMITKMVTLNVVSLIVFGVALIYMIQGYPTFTSDSQKILLIILSGFFVLMSAVSLYLLNKPIRLSLTKQFKTFKWVDTIQFFVISILIVLHIITFYVFTAQVYQSSMQPTLSEGDRLIVYQFDYEPKRNDIVVIFMDSDHYLGADDSHYVKRIVGLPGDTITVNGSNQLLINGEVVQQLPTSYVEKVVNLIAFLPENKIQPGFYFVLGDNVANSQDSRSLGFIREEDIKAKVIFRFFPKVGVIE